MSSFSSRSSLRPRVPTGPHQEKALRLAGVCITHYLSLTPRVLVVLHREIAKRQFASLPHGSFTPTVVLTEPPPLLGPVSRAVAGREYHYHPDCHGHTGSNPVLEQVFSLASLGRVVAYQTRWLALSRIVRTDVLSECVFSCQGASLQVPFAVIDYRQRKESCFIVVFEV